MKKLMLTLAAIAIAASALNAQVTNQQVVNEEPDRVQMRALSKDPTGIDIKTSNEDVKDEPTQCTKLKGQKV